MSDFHELAGIDRVASIYSASETSQRLTNSIQARNLTLFARIDFSADAYHVGLSLRFSELVIFGNPRAGTPIIAARPSAAIDLPLKILIDEDADGTVRLSCNEPGYLQRRYGIPDDLIGNIAGATVIMKEVAGSL